MRRIETGELNNLADFIVEWFYEKEQRQRMMQGVEPQRAKDFM